MEHSLLANSVISGSALLGTVAAIAVIRARATLDGLASRFVLALTLVALVMGMRLLAWNTGLGVSETLTRLFAVWMPLAALLVVEGLQRRHAPPLAKFVMLGGGVVFSLLAFLNGGLGFPLYLLLLFQLLGFGGVYLLAIFGNQNGLSAQERSVIGRLRIAVPVMLAFLATDYGVFEQVLPIRASGIGILLFCWMAIGPSGATTGRGEALFALAVSVVTAAIVGAAAAGIAGLGWPFGVQVASMTLCAGLLGLVTTETLRAFAEGRRDDLMRALAGADTSDFDRFADSFFGASPLAGSTVLRGEILRDYDMMLLADAFAARPVLSRKDLALLPEGGREQIDSLLVTHDATHLVLMSNEPLVLVATTLPAVGRNSAVDTELKLLHRMSMLVAQQGKP